MTVQYLAIDGGSLAYEVHGTSGPLVLCAPAMGDLRNAYTPLATQLAGDGFTVVCIDPRGHGDSSTTFQAYGDEASAADYIALIEALKLGPAVLLGASFSAASATIAAAQRPDLVRGVILLGPFLRLGMGVAGLYLMKTLVMRPWGPTVWKAFSKSLWPGLGPEGAAKRAGECMESLTKPGKWTAFQKTVDGADHRVVEPWLPKINGVPALVVMGELDPDFGKPKEEAEWVAANFANGKVMMVPECGHAPHLERPEAVGAEVLRFLRGL